MSKQTHAFLDVSNQVILILNELNKRFKRAVLFTGVTINHIKRVLRDLCCAYDFAGSNNPVAHRYKRVLADFNYLVKRGKHYPRLELGEEERDLDEHDTYNNPSPNDSQNPSVSLEPAFAPAVSFIVPPTSESDEESAAEVIYYVKRGL